MGAAAFALAPTAAAGTSRADQFGIAAGGDMHTLARADLVRELANYEAVGARWIRFDIDWSVVQAGGRSSYDWAPFDAVVREARLRGIRVLGILNHSPVWARPPRTPKAHPPVVLADYARFVAAATRRYGPIGVRHWQIWNEPNIVPGWVRPDVAAYTRMLAVAHGAVKRVDPGATVVTAGTAPAVSDGTNVAPLDFVRGLYAKGARPYFDALGHHASTFPAFPSEPHGWSAWYQMVGSSPSLRSVMVENGDEAKEIWVTEFSAPTKTDRGVTEAQQAAMLAEAYSLAASYPWAGPVFWYSFRDRRATARAWQDFCGLLRYDFSRKPAFFTYRRLATGAPASARAGQLGGRGLLEPRVTS